jgi:hypothetical protein
MNRLVRFSPLFPLALVLLPSACAVTPGDLPDEGDGALASAQPIINGAVSDPVPVGVVLVQSSGGLCSGTLLSNRWVVSARHCFDASAATAPSSVSITLGAQVRAAAEVILHESRDVALVRLDLPMVMNNSITGWDRSFFAGSLVGRTVRCMGYGRNTYNGGAGVFRVADLQVTGTSGDDFVVSPNRVGQVPWRGDSGGPCMVTMPDGRQMIAGVASTASHDGSSQVFSANYLSAPTFREWAAESRVAKELIARHSGLCLEARNAVTTNGFAEQWTCDGGADQRWRFDAAGSSSLGALFRLRDAASGKCLTVSSLQGGNGTPMTVMPCGPSDAQRFLLDDMGGGFRRVRNVFTNRCLDVPSSSLVDGARLQQSTCHGGANQQFALRVHMEDGVHEVSGVGSARCFDLPNASLAPQTRLQQSTCNLQTNQEFRFEEVANGEFRVRPKHSNLCLDIADASTADHGVVQQFTCHSGTNQRFRLLYQTGGVYQLQGVGSGRCIDVPDASTANGVFLQQSLCHSGSNQRWRMRL